MEREQGRKVATEEMWDYLSEGENKETTTAMELSIPKATNGASSPPPLLLADGQANKKKFEKAKEEIDFDKRLYIVLIRCAETTLQKFQPQVGKFSLLEGNFFLKKFNYKINTRKLMIPVMLMNFTKA
jgi:hypothetical protein